MTYRQARNLFGAVALVALIVSQAGAIVTTAPWGTMVWVVGLLVTAIASPAFGVCLRRCVDGHESEPWWGAR